VLRLLAKNPVGYFSNPAFLRGESDYFAISGLAQSRDAVTVPGDNFRRRHHHQAEMQLPKTVPEIVPPLF
jgi:hypothetical protein